MITTKNCNIPADLCMEFGLNFKICAADKTPCRCPPQAPSAPSAPVRPGPLVPRISPLQHLNAPPRMFGISQNAGPNFGGSGRGGMSAPTVNNIFNQQFGVPGPDAGNPGNGGGNDGGNTLVDLPEVPNGIHTNADVHLPAVPTNQAMDVSAEDSPAASAAVTRGEIVPQYPYPEGGWTDAAFPEPAPAVPAPAAPWHDPASVAQANQMAAAVAQAQQAANAGPAPWHNPADAEMQQAPWHDPAAVAETSQMAEAVAQAQQAASAGPAPWHNPADAEMQQAPWHDAAAVAQANQMAEAVAQAQQAANAGPAPWHDTQMVQAAQAAADDAHAQVISLAAIEAREAAETQRRVLAAAQAAAQEAHDETIALAAMDAREAAQQQRLVQAAAQAAADDAHAQVIALAAIEAREAAETQRRVLAAAQTAAQQVQLQNMIAAAQTAAQQVQNQSMLSEEIPTDTLRALQDITSIPERALRALPPRPLGPRVGEVVRAIESPSPSAPLTRTPPNRRTSRAATTSPPLLTLPRRRQHVLPEPNTLEREQAQDERIAAARDPMRREPRPRRQTTPSA